MDGDRKCLRFAPLHRKRCGEATRRRKSFPVWYLIWLQRIVKNLAVLCFLGLVLDDCVRRRVTDRDCNFLSIILVVIIVWRFCFLESYVGTTFGCWNRHRSCHRSRISSSLAWFAAWRWSFTSFQFRFWWEHAVSDEDPADRRDRCAAEWSSKARAEVEAKAAVRAAISRRPSDLVGGAARRWRWSRAELRLPGQNGPQLHRGQWREALVPVRSQPL